MDQVLGEVLVARQPILDTTLTIVGYELLYRDPHGLPLSVGGDGARATATVLVDGLLGLGREVIDDDEDAFINVPVSLLVAGTLLDLPTRHVVLELLADAEPTPEVREALVRHRRAGFRLALDDVVPDDPRLALIDLVDLVKVDTGRFPQPRELAFVRELTGAGVPVVAEKVERAEDFDRFVGAGAELIQGFFFTEPRAVRATRPVGLPPAHLELLRELALDEVDLGRIEELIRTDLTLTDRFLRLVERAHGWREVESLHHGLVLLGTRRLQRWVTLLVMSAVARSAPAQLLTTASVRARYCEELQRQRGGAGSLQAFGLGMFSVLGGAGLLAGGDVTDLPLDDAARAALRGEAGELRDLLDVAIAAEQADWQALVATGRRLGLTPRQLALAHVEALRWQAEAEPLVA
ncbi:MAG: EAL and HDOD domain-containing protein [Nitriliruptoraceae bacterium]